MKGTALLIQWRSQKEVISDTTLTLEDIQVNLNSLASICYR